MNAPFSRSMVPVWPEATWLDVTHRIPTGGYLTSLGNSCFLLLNYHAMSHLTSCQTRVYVVGETLTDVRYVADLPGTVEGQWEELPSRLAELIL